MNGKEKSGGITEIIELPEGVEANVEKGIVIIKGEKGEVKKNLLSKKVSIKSKDKTVVLVANKNTKREKKLVGSFKSHIKNMITGVTKGFEYRMKICSGHFPMSILVENKEIVVKNFLGEKVPRKTKVLEGVEIKIEGDELVLTGLDKEKVSQMSADIEQLTRRPGFDTRIFQDGIYITSKAGKAIR